MVHRLCAACLCGLITLLAAPAWAQISANRFAQTACGAADPLFRSGLEAAERADNRASGGGGGVFPGATSLQVLVPDSGRTHLAYLYVPQTYSRQTAWALILVLHGAGGSPAAADAQAQLLRDYWQSMAEQSGAVIVVPVASGMSGGWVPSLDTPALACLLRDVETLYSIDRRRRFLWGFSAGAHYGHALALANTDRFAAYAVKAGALAALACNPAGGAAGCASTLPQVARRIPAQLRVGMDDPLRPHTEADSVRLDDAGWTPGLDLSVTIVGGSHEVLVNDADEAALWFVGFRLP